MKLPERQRDAHKGDFGRVLVIGGSRGMAGAISLSAIAALKTGSGLVSAAVPDRCLETVASFHPGIMTIPLKDTADGQFANFDANLTPITRLFSSQSSIGCGPGMRTGDGAVQLVEQLLWRTKTPRVLDADALNVIAHQRFFDSPALPRDQSRLVITPHPGELARITQVAADNREEQIRATEALVQRLGFTVVVKGGPTVVVYPSATGTPNRWINQTGNPGMATAGSGDVLTGMIASLLGQGLATADAARLGVHLHGTAGDLAAASHSEAGMTCVDILHCIPAALVKNATNQP